MNGSDLTMPTDVEPLIFTSLGNVRYDSLEHEVQWEIGKGHVACILIAKKNGEIVKREPHVLLLEGIDLGGATEKIN
jgi:hypothetical protein